MALAVFAMLAPAARADDTDVKAIKDQIAAMAAKGAEGAKAEILVGRIELVDMKPARDQTFDIAIKPNTEYHVYGACDRACDDLDLSGRDEEFNELDIDTEDDDTPILIFKSGAAKQLRLKVFMSGCDRPSCQAGFGVYEAP